MITGRTGEKILVTGIYYCQQHRDNEFSLIQGDLFPHCSKDNTHSAIWEFKNEERSGGNEASQEDTNPKHAFWVATQEKIKDNDRMASKQSEEEGVYKRKGFFAALNHYQYPETGVYRLEYVLEDEMKSSIAAKEEMETKFNERLATIKEGLVYLDRMIAEKVTLKKEFSTVLEHMQSEYELIKNEIKDYYIQLREEIRAFGNAKEDLVHKRIDKFEEEINKIVKIYQEVEAVQNEKFKKDFEARKLKDSDKQFYYDYRDSLHRSLDNVHKRVHALNKEGLNLTISRFLIAIGWTAAFVSSWFFVLWYEDPSMSNSTISSNIVIYILDNLRNFVLYTPPLVSIGVFAGYILLIYLISIFCYHRLVREGFIIRKKPVKEMQSSSPDSIDFSMGKDDLIKAQFKAASWYELWLKIAPFVAMLLLLLVILAIGSKRVDEDGSLMTYEMLSKTLSLQVTGFLLPIAMTGLMFMYITKVTEARVPDEENGNGHGQNGSRSAIVLFAIVSFGLLIGLFILNELQIPGLGMKQTGAWGFFTGSICAGLSLGYGYRFVSLHESADVLTERIHDVSRYIEKTFYPFEVNYIKDWRIFMRMKVLYHSLLTLIESRNDLATRMVNPDHKSTLSDHEAQKSTDNATNSKPEPGIADENRGYPDKEHRNPVRRFFNGIAEAFRIQRQRLKAKDAEIENLEDKINDLKKDTIDIEEGTYFPEAAARVKELKVLIEERAKQLEKLKEELDGYFRNEKTWASLNQQIENLNARKAELARAIESLQLFNLEKKKAVDEYLARRTVYLSEGYNLGTWFSKNNDNSPAA